MALPLGIKGLTNRTVNGRKTNRGQVHILVPFGRRTTFGYDSGKIRTIQDPADVGRKQGCLTCATAAVSSLALIAVSE